jgi:hypothetical protein
MPSELLVISIPAIIALVVLGIVLWQVRKQRRFTNRLGEALGAERSRGQMNGTHDGIPYHFRWQPGSRNSPSYLRVFVDCLSPGQFRVIREGALERFFLKLGIASPIRTGDTAFDQEFYILSNETDFASGYFHDPQRRQAVVDIFRMGFTEVKHDGKVMEARWSPFAMSDDVDPRVVTAPLSQLSLLAKIEGTPFPYQPLAFAPQGISWKTKRALAFAVPILLLLTGFVALIWGQVNFEPLDGGALFLESLKISIPALLLFSWIALRLLRGRSGSHRELLVVLGLSLLAFPLSGFGGGVAVNGWFDTSPPLVHQAMVVKKFSTRSKNSTNYHLLLRSWRSPTDTEKLSVSKRLHDRVAPGKTVVTAVSKKGYLGYEWWVSYGIADGKVLQ